MGLSQSVSVVDLSGIYLDKQNVHFAQTAAQPQVFEKALAETEARQQDVPSVADAVGIMPAHDASTTPWPGA